MSLANRLRQSRDWVPIPDSGGRVHLVRWVLLEGNRIAVTGAIITVVYVLLLATGWYWTDEMQMILTETSTVENILESFMSGILLLVSIVVSINSIVLSQDIASVQNQEDRARGAREFRDDIGHLSESGESPSDPRAFLQLMGAVITDRAETLVAASQEAEAELADEIESYGKEVLDSVDHLVDLDAAHGGDFTALWIALDVDSGRAVDRSRALRSAYDSELPDECNEKWEDLLESLQLFAIGRKNFKTLYYYKEVSTLSRTLLIVSLPAILATAASILAINAGLLPNVWLFGLPPLQSFVATTFTIALLPYIVLTSYMLRLSTVAIRTATGGPFSLRD